MIERKNFVKKVGRQRLLGRLGVTQQAMTNALKRGFPAQWFAASKELADERNVECPPNLFGMIGVDASDVDSQKEPAE